MMDIKIGLVVIDVLLGLFGVLFWFSKEFAHSVGVEGFLPRFGAGLVCFILLIIITAIANK